MQSVAILCFLPIFVFADKAICLSKRLERYLKIAVWKKPFVSHAPPFFIAFSLNSPATGLLIPRLRFVCLQMILLLTTTFKNVYNQNDEYEKN